MRTPPATQPIREGTLCGQREHFKNKIRTGPNRPANASLRTRHPAGGIEGPVAIEPNDAKFDARADAGKAAVLNDGEVHDAHLAVADRGLRGAEAAGDSSRLPGAKCDFANICEPGDLQG